MLDTETNRPSELATQHQRWAPAHERLWVGDVRSKPKATPVKPRPVSPFKRPHVEAKPRWSRLFVRPIDEVDEFGNVVFDGYMPQWKRITIEVCAKHNVALNEIRSTRRDRLIVAARHEAFWRCKKETSMSYPQIGAKFGDRDHTTVLHGIRKHEQRMREAAHG